VAGRMSRGSNPMRIGLSFSEMHKAFFWPNVTLKSELLAQMAVLGAFGYSYLNNILVLDY
jgi:hypothetical protein